MHPERIKGLFVDKEPNPKGIYTLKLYVRGKPWIVQVDDVMLVDMQEFRNDDRMNGLDELSNQLRYAKYYEDYNSLWAPILEKAFMKLRGNYEGNHGGREANAMRMLTGAPVLTYTAAFMGHEEIYKVIKEGHDKGYPMIIGVAGADSQHENQCGVTEQHAFSILAAFDLVDKNGKLAH